MRRVGSQNDKSLLRWDTFGSFVKLYHTCSLVIEYFGEAVLHHLTAAPGATVPLLPSLSYPLHLTHSLSRISSYAAGPSPPPK